MHVPLLCSQILYHLYSLILVINKKNPSTLLIYSTLLVCYIGESIGIVFQKGFHPVVFRVWCYNSCTTNNRAGGNGEPLEPPYFVRLISYPYSDQGERGGGRLCPPHYLVPTKFFDIPAALKRRRKQQVVALPLVTEEARNEWEASLYRFLACLPYQKSDTKLSYFELITEILTFKE